MLCYVMLCYRAASRYACNETNLMHYLPSVFSVTVPLLSAGLVEIGLQSHPDQTSWQSTQTYNTYQLSYIYMCTYIYIVTSWWWATSKPETCRGSGVPRNFFGRWGFKNSVEHRGQRERGSGGGSPLVRGSTQFANEWNPYSYWVVPHVFSTEQGIRMSFVKTPVFRGGGLKPPPLGRPLCRIIVTE
jgi:hypothetical protein